MEFRDYAARETSALIERLLATWSEGALQQLRGLREAIDAATLAVEVPGDPATHAEGEIQELTRRLNSAAGTAMRAAVQRAQDEAQAALDAVKEELQVEQSRSDQLAASLAHAQAQSEALEAALREEKHRAETADHDLDAALEAHRVLETAHNEAEAGRQQEATARIVLEQELKETIGLLDAVRAEATRLGEQLETERAAASAALGDAERLEAQLAARAAEHETLESVLAAQRDDLDAVRSERDSIASRLDRALAEVDALTAARDMVVAELENLTAEHEGAAERLAAVASERDALRADREALAAERDALIVDRDALAAGRDALIGDRDAVAAERDALTAERDALAAERDGLIADRDMLAAERDAVAADRDLAALERSAMTAERDALAADRDQIAAERDVIVAQRSAIASERDATVAERDSLATRLDAASVQILTLQQRHADQEERIAQLETGRSLAAETEASLMEELTVTTEALAASRAAASRVESERNEAVSVLDASVRAVDELSGAAAVTGLLAVLVRHLSTCFSRVAVFRVKGNRLEGEHQAGFDETSDVTKLVVPLNLDSLLSRAVSSGTAVRLAGGNTADGGLAPFGATSGTALAMPILVRGETVAIVYLEQPDEPQEAADPRTTFATLLVQSAASLASHLMQQLKALDELRDYAALLVQEAEDMFAADVSAGKTDDDLRRRLADTIDCARQLFSQRAGDSGAAAALLDERIGAVLDARGDTPFARALAGVAGLDAPARGASGPRQAAG